ncbi:RNA polymerase sigma factor [Aliifodinibius sp. S!AR15-10]|uniref:RNA polymerase sigma factor n=1 Tax=Aliifodinibius sp. S!AR15-10 TaxID=2950437 RepID=UPI0028606E42|nr:RNA polymerase sigma factor [Aliifodinibius sp. S!AR15-10]MDR8390524.1 RNA polymerase sigma factor [Aliifodinibius sp. S!AR15-10]
MDSTSDKALMEKVRDGDLDKLGLLFERYNRRLFGFFYRMTARRDVSEDLVQGVFERILKYRKSYSANGDFSTWIFQIARNLHADHYRKMEKLDEEHALDWDSLPGDSEVPQLESDQGREQQMLKQALARLDPVKKQTLILSRFEGFKYKEIAEIMDCTESAVKVRVFRGLNELKEIMSDLRKEEEL